MTDCPVIPLNVGRDENNKKTGIYASNKLDMPWYMMKKDDEHILNQGSKNPNGFLYGIQNKYIVIDTDTKEAYKIVKSWIKENTMNYSRTQSFSWSEENNFKYHYWFCINNSKLKHIRSIINNKIGLDIITDKVLEKSTIKDSTFGRYELQLPHFEKLINKLSYDTKKALTQINELKELSYVDYKLIKNEPKQEPREQEQKTETIIKDNDYKFISALLKNLDDEYYEDYEKWRNVGLCLHSLLDEGYKSDKIHPMFVKFSKQWNKFNLDELNKFWYSIKSVDGGLSLGSLCQYSKESNEQEHENIKKRYGKIRENKKDEINEIDVEEENKKIKKAVVDEMNKNIFYLKSTKFYYEKDINNNYNPHPRKAMVETYEATTTEIYKQTPRAIIKTNVNNFEIWAKHPERRTYEDMVFNPNPDFKDERIINKFKGFKWDEKDFIFQENKFNNIMKLINHVCVDNVPWFLDWLAWIVQKPHIKTDIFVLLNSRLHGVGKNLVVSICERLFSGYTSKIDDIEQIFTKFNADIADKLLIHSDEIKAQEKCIYDKLKNVITRTTFRMERKGLDAFSNYNDFSNYIFTTNNDYSLKVEEQDRRSALFHATEKRLLDDEYVEIANEIDNDESIKHFFNYLKNRDISHWTGKMKPFTSELKLQTINNNLPAYIDFIFDDIINERYILFNNNEKTKMDFSTFIVHLTRYCIENKKSQNFNKRHITPAIMSYFNKNEEIIKFIGIGGKHKIYYEFDAFDVSLKKLRNLNPSMFEGYYD